MELSARFERKAADCWIGLYWQRNTAYGIDAWLCLLPMLPLHITLRRSR